MSTKRLSRRSFLKMCSLTAAGAILAGCAPKATQPPAQPTKAGEEPSEVPSSEQQVTIRWYANADTTRNNWMEQVAIPKFKEIKPNYTIETIIVPWDEFDPKLTNMFAAGDLPEVWGNWGSTGYGEYALRGMCIYVDDYIDADAEYLNLKDIPEAAIEGVRVQGKLVGLPLYILGTYTYYNKEIFENAGIPFPPSNWDDKSWDWARMLEVAKQLTKDYENPETGQYGVQLSLGSPEELPWLWGFEIWPADATKTSKTKEIYFTDPKVIESFQAQADLVCKHKVSPDAAISSAISAAGDPFQVGKVAMNMSGGWGFWGLKEVEGTFRWGAAALPRGPYGDLKDALYADPMLISSQTKYKDEAWQFVRYIYSEEGMRDFSVATWSPPSRQSVLPDWVNLWDESVRAELTESLQGSWKYGEVTPWNRIAGYSQFYDAIYSELDAVYLCEAQMADVVATIDAKVEEILAGLEWNQ